ncbi:MAG: M28 family peptidase [Planctomycetia bacterium]|nr:M28 family peptidase [Planctomycetia bacterium]
MSMFHPLPGTRRALAALAVVLLLAGVGGRAAEEAAIEARLLKDITYLASAECEGRGVDTKGIDKAADYIAAEFQKLGLKHAPGLKDYFQPFTIKGGAAKLEEPNAVRLLGPQNQETDLELNKTFRPLGMSGAGKVTKAPVVFAGYGATIKEADYDDFKGLDVAGKVVIFIRKSPNFKNAKIDADKLTSYQSLQTKISNAEAHKAAAIIIVNDQDTAKNDDPLMDFAYTATSPTSAKIPAIHVKRSVVDALLQASLNKKLEDLEKAIDQEGKPQSTVLKDAAATLDVNVKRQTLNVKNVIGVLEGNGPLAKETVVIGAHYDHLGFGGFGSLAKGLKQPAIHHGADDNGSGTTTLLELARRFAGQKDRQGRRLVFMAFSGEERGLLGSDHYCRNPLIPLADTVAMVNLDMVGRLRADDKTKKDKLIVYGTGTAKTFDSLIESLNENYSFQMQKVPGGMGPSDHASFYQRKIPVFFFFTGDHPDYHRPTDTAEKINIAGMRKIADLVTDLVTHLGTVAERPEYVFVPSPKSPSAQGPRIGIRPDYGSDKEGVLLGGVVEGGPAQKAGLKEGDLIIAVGEKPAKDLQTYMVLMANYKKGDKVPLTILRDEKKMMITVVPD